MPDDPSTSCDFSGLYRAILAPLWRYLTHLPGKGIMKTLLVGPVFCCANLFAGTAPDTVAGMVYHETSGYNVGGGLGSLGWRTVLLRPDGSCGFPNSASASYIENVGGSYHLGSTIAADGTYAYTKTSDSTATLTIINANTNTQTVTLTFSEPMAGTLSGTLPPSIAVNGYFYFAEADRVSTAPTCNMAVRGNVTPDHPVIAGFVVPGSKPTDVLIRAIGPTLAQFGVAGAWDDPDFIVYRTNNGLTGQADRGAHYGDWSGHSNGTTGTTIYSAEAALQQMFTAAGAFALPSGSKDAVAYIRLWPGVYTVVCAPGKNSTGGEVLIEVYLLP
jgi:hypothetical protein